MVLISTHAYLILACGGGHVLIQFNGVGSIRVNASNKWIMAPS